MENGREGCRLFVEKERNCQLSTNGGDCMIGYCGKVCLFYRKKYGLVLCVEIATYGWSL